MAAVQCSHSAKAAVTVFWAIGEAGERAGPELDAELMPPEQPSGSRWWNRLPGRGGGRRLGSRAVPGGFATW